MSVLLKDLLVETRDGDWGVESPSPEHSPRYVIRGTDFAQARRRQVSGVPLRYLPDRNVGSRTLRPGDILLETAGGSRDQPTGRTLLVTRDLLDNFRGDVIGASFTRFLRADTNLVDPRYLYWYFQWIYLRGDTYEFQVQHTGIARFQYTVFASSREIPLPSLDDQRAIAEVLGALDDKIAANDHALQLMDELVRARFEALTGELVPLSHVAFNWRKHVEPTQVDPETPYVGLEHVPRRRMWLTEADVASGVTSAKSAFAEGDVLFGKLRPYFHKVARAPFGGVCSTDILVVRAKDPSLAGYVLAAASSDRAVRETTAASEGTRMPRTKWADLGAVEVAWPGETAARAISQAVSEIGKLAGSLAEESRRLGRTRDELLPLLMSGRVRVKDAKTAVEEVL